MDPEYILNGAPKEKKQIIPEAHALLLEKIRLLERQDPAFKYLATILSDRLDLMRNRGDSYGHVSDTVYFEGDVSARVLVTTKVQRMRHVAKNGEQFHPDAKVLDSIQDATNYLDIWLCCREAHKHSGTEKV